MLRLFRLLAALSALALLLGNSNCSKNNASDAPQFVTSLTIQNSSSLPSSGFAQGDVIQFVLTVRNRTNAAQTLFFNSDEAVNFAVVNAGTADVVWNCDNDLTTCTASATLNGTSSSGSGFTEIDLAAFETKSVTFSWTQLDNSGSQIATGNYEVLGGFTVYNTTGAGNAADNGNSMAQGQPTAAQLFPTVYRSVLTPFSIQ